MGKLSEDSSEQHQAAACAGKHRFDDARMARDVAARSRRNRGDSRAAYRCSWCGGWHIGGTDRRKRRRT